MHRIYESKKQSIKGYLVEFIPTGSEEDITHYREGFYNTLVYPTLKSAYEVNEELKSRVSFIHYPIYTSRLTSLLDGSFPYYTYLRDFSEIKPDFIAFPAYIWSIQWILDFIPYIKGVLEDVKIILGGPQMNSLQTVSALMKEYEEIEFVIRGQGELPFRYLLEWMLGKHRVEDIKGLSYRKGDKIHHREELYKIDSLDEFPSIITGGYLIPGSKNSILALQLSRGCIYNCSFCNWGVDCINPKRTIISNSIERAMEELRFIFSNYPGCIYLQYFDGFFLGGNLNKVKEFMRRVIALRKEMNFYGVPLSGWLNYLTADDELIKLCIEAMFIPYSIGLQTFNQDNWVEMGRPRSHYKKILDYIKLLKKYSLPLLVDTLIGLPTETKEDYYYTLERVIEEIDPDGINTNILRVLPHSKYYTLRDSEPYRIKLSNGFLLATGKMTFNDIRGCWKMVWGLRIGYEFHKQSFRLLCKLLNRSMTRVFEDISDWLCNQKGYENDQGPQEFETLFFIREKIHRYYLEFLDELAEKNSVVAPTLRTLKEIAAYDMLKIMTRMLEDPRTGDHLCTFNDLRGRYFPAEYVRLSDETVLVPSRYRLTEASFDITAVVARALTIDESPQLSAFLSGIQSEFTYYLFHGASSLGITMNEYRLLFHIKNHEKITLNDLYVQKELGMSRDEIHNKVVEFSNKYILLIYE